MSAGLPISHTHQLVVAGHDPSDVVVALLGTAKSLMAVPETVAAARVAQKLLCAREFIRCLLYGGWVSGPLRFCGWMEVCHLREA